MDPVRTEIVAVTDVGPDTIALTFAAPPGFDARPGQFIQLRLEIHDEFVTRHYSISSPRVSDVFEVTVKIDPDGALTPALRGMTAGDTVLIDGPYGEVYHDGADGVIILAAGPGIGPAVGVAERVLADGGDAVLIYETGELVHEQRLADFAAAGGDSYIVTAGVSVLAAVSAAMSDGQVFIYGFEPFVRRARQALDDAGGDPAAAKIENFG